MNNELKYAPGLLERARCSRDYWAGYRRERERNKQFTYGNQWSDVVDDNGVLRREEDVIRGQGNLPLKNNLIRRLVRNVLGVYRNRWELPRCVARDAAERIQAVTMNKLLRYNAQLNRLDELYARSMEEFLVGGLVVHKKWYGYREGFSDCRTDMVAPDKFFMDVSSRDFRGGDVSLIGELHDMTYGEAVAAFGENPVVAEHMRKQWGNRGFDGFESDRRDCQVVEVWHKAYEARYHCHDMQSGRMLVLKSPDDVEMIREKVAHGKRCENLFKVTRCVEEVWRYACLTADGVVLASGESPYAHGRHPYVFKAYPFVDGEIHSFVNDIIDQQKLTNRLISMYDWILRASAKGVLLFPEGALPDGVDIADVAEEWSRFNGVIVYRPRTGVPLPQQVSSNSTDIGITGLLEIQMKMMEDISGVNGALQGKLDNNSMSGTLYNQQTQNSMTALADLMRTFDDFVKEATAVDISNMRQFYTQRRVEAICGEGATISRSHGNYMHPRMDFSVEV
ncbi:MAG: hypothetical protein NC204_06020 [Candidatus Amulumruptor caecigallinarius]|nr:hypothetical protein [Candidatus Amulumruptor caecigallinarius]